MDTSLPTVVTEIMAAIQYLITSLQPVGVEVVLTADPTEDLVAVEAVGTVTVELQLLAKGTMVVLVENFISVEVEEEKDKLEKL